MPTGTELPTFKGRPGWEFTDISGLDLAAYERVGADGAELPARAELPAPRPSGSCRRPSCPRA